MKVLKAKQWEYRLFEKDEKLYLDVVISSSMFIDSVLIEVIPSDVQDIKNCLNEIGDFAAKISNDYKKYKDRILDRKSFTFPKWEDSPDEVKE